MIWRTSRGKVEFAGRGMIMGILNVTPDSFSDGGRFLDLDAAVEHGLRMVEEGAGIIDIGGESTRPGAEEVDTARELARVLPVIERLRERAPACLLSVDTSKAAVARAACERGADIINDVTALRRDPAMIEVAAETGAGLILMHMKGTPRTMQQDPRYDDVTEEVAGFLEKQMRLAVAGGVDPEQIALDPGLGFGKTAEHNLELLRSLPRFVDMGRPVVLGVSRKSFFGKIVQAPLEERVWPTLAVTTYARAAGVLIHRVHDVRPNLQALRMTEAILEKS